MRVLVADDDASIARLIASALSRRGHAVDLAANGTDALWMASEVAYDIVVLDVNLPPPDGLDVCRRLRADGNWVPIVLITGASEVEDRVRGLDAGADDFISKPFDLDELFARMRANTRRPSTTRPSVVEFNGVVLDRAARRATRDGREVRLSPKEFALLEQFIRHPGELLSREHIESKLWDFAFEAQSNIVDSLVRRLRDKLGDSNPNGLITTVRGEGYRFG